MRRRARWVVVVGALAPLLAAGTPPAGAGTGSFADATGDSSAYFYDEHGDITAVGARFGGGVLELTMAVGAVERFDSPRWFSDRIDVTWTLAPDGNLDGVTLRVRISSTPNGPVLEVAEEACPGATATISGSAYVATVPLACLDDPGSVALSAELHYDPLLGVDGDRNLDFAPSDWRSAFGPVLAGDGHTPLPPPRATDLACPTDRVPPSGFPDVPPGTPLRADVDCVVWWEVTTGRDDGSYGPDVPVTRGQMASFLARALFPGIPGGTNNFDDDDGSAHEHAIDVLANQNIVAGKSARTFDPDGHVTRDQLATFIWRAVQPYPPAGNYFADDDGSSHQYPVNSLAEIGLAVGAEGTQYFPSRPVTRAEMATFVVRMLDVAIERGFEQPHP